jgi:hypothetical protein
LGVWFLWVVFLENYRSSANYWANFFHGPKLRINLDKKWVGLHLRPFFTNSSVTMVTGANHLSTKTGNLASNSPIF